jgi:tetratricopeptide (TPR) repeat protein
LPVNALPPPLPTTPPPLPSTPPPLPQRRQPRDYYFFIDKDILFTDKAEADLVISNPDTIIQQTPHTAADYLMRGKAHACKDEYDLAATDYAKALEMDNSYNTLANYAFICYYKNDIDGLAEKAGKLIKMESDLIYGYIAKAYAHSRKNEYDKAIIEWTQVIKRNPSGCEYWHEWRGNSYFHIKDFQKAIQDYTKTIEIKPDRHIAYYRRGMAYIELAAIHNKEKSKFIDNFKLAISDFTKASQLAPENADYAKTLADYNKMYSNIKQ